MPNLAKVANSPEGKQAADWKMIYIAEAHCMSEWPVRSGRCNRGRGPVIVEHQPATANERCDLANQFARDFDVALDADSLQILVDDPEQEDPFEKAYAPWPLRLYLIREGRVQWIAQPEGGSFDKAVTELMGLLRIHNY